MPILSVGEIHRNIQGRVKELVSHPGVRWFGVGSVTTLFVTFVTITLGWKEYLAFNLVTVCVVVVLLMRYLEDRGVVQLTPCQCGVTRRPMPQVWIRIWMWMGVRREERAWPPSVSPHPFRTPSC